MEIIWIMTFIFPALTEYHVIKPNRILKVPKNEYLLEEVNFLRLARMRIYVDKTLMLFELFKDRVRWEEICREKGRYAMRPAIYVLTAPPCFGKSTNIDMLEKFLSIPMTDCGAFDTWTFDMNRRIFRTLRVYRWSRTFFQEHYGQYPVINVHFKHYSTSTIEDTIIRATRKCFRDHSYLSNSTKLSDDDRCICEQWLNDIQIHLHGLSALFKFLFTHFNKKVVLLIDDFDVIVTKPIFSLYTTDFSKVEFVQSWFAELLLGNEYLDMAIIMGISRIIASIVMPTETRKYGFLDKHVYGQFFGFTETEVQRIHRRVKHPMTVEESNKIRAWYNGYKTIRIFDIYNPISVFEYLKYGTVGRYWCKNRDLQFFDTAIRLRVIKSRIFMMIRNLTIGYIPYHHYGFNVTQMLYDLVVRGDETADISTLFKIWLEQGFITYFIGIYTITVPNLEVRQEIVSRLRTHFINDVKLDGRKIALCSDFINNFNTTMQNTDETFRQQIIVFRQNLKSLMKSVNSRCVNITDEYALDHILFFIISDLDEFIIKSEIYGPKHIFGKRNPSYSVYLLRGDFVVVIDLEYNFDKTPDSKIGLETILENYPYFQQIYFTRHPNITNKLLIGISTNVNSDISVSYMYNKVKIRHAITVP